MRVLLIEDDSMIGEAIVQALRDEAYAVDWVKDGRDALATTGLEAYDILLLDLGLPGCDGIDVLQKLRQRGLGLPILVITARDALEERVHGLDLGADDYLVKPFEIAELLARMRSVYRRRGGVASPVLSNGDLTLDPASKKATFRETECQLTGREFAVLQALLIRPGAILSRTQLEERVYGWNEEVESNAIEFLIHAIRKKLGSEVIRNMRGIGWLVEREK